MRKPSIFTLTVLFFFVSLSGVAMAWSSEMVLFSEVNGTVTSEGQPVAGAEVERISHWGWKDVERRDSTTTGADGRFHFPAVVESSFFGAFMPHEPLVSQKIMIRHQGSEYKGWKHTKHNYKHNGELKGKPINITCALETEPTLKEDVKVYGICTFD